VQNSVKKKKKTGQCFPACMQADMAKPRDAFVATFVANASK
jgi:hypothetical protein